MPIIERQFDDGLTDEIFEKVRSERYRQFEKWGIQLHSDAIYFLIMLEEAGEVAQAILHDLFGGKAKGTMEEELIQLTAVCVQWLEIKQKQRRKKSKKEV